MYELWHGECDLIEDISMLQRNYHDSLLRLGLITESEAEQIFGGIHSLLPIHSELREELTKAKGPDGSVESVGNILLKWVCNVLPCGYGQNYFSAESAFCFIVGAKIGDLCDPLCQPNPS